jgi:hypothetical protein
MKLARLALVASALVFLVVGALFLVAPVRWGTTVEILLPTAMARTDFRATYGGFDFAIGVFLLLCARRAEWLRPGLLALGLAAAGYGGGRLWGILVEGGASALMLTFVSIEALTALVAFYLLRRLPHST